MYYFNLYVFMYSIWKDGGGGKGGVCELKLVVKRVKVMEDQASAPGIHDS